MNNYYSRRLKIMRKALINWPLRKGKYFKLEANFIQNFANFY